MSQLYLSIKETAEYLSLSEEAVEKLLQQGKIKAIHDGEQYLINKGQFNTYFKQMERYKEIMEEYYSEPIPEDKDIKDED